LHENLEISELKGIELHTEVMHLGVRIELAQKALLLTIMNQKIPDKECNDSA
jgi:hypothetical protein